MNSPTPGLAPEPLLFKGVMAEPANKNGLKEKKRT